MKHPQKLPHQSQSKPTDNINISASEALAITNDLYPAILLNGSSDVIDVSDNFRSCHGKAVDRTVLMNSMSTHEFSRLDEFCRQTPSTLGEYINSADNTLLLELKLYKYRLGLCKKLDSFASHITVIYLAKKQEELELLEILTDRYFPKEFFNIFKCRTLRSHSPFYNAVLTLFDPGDEFDANEATIFLRSIAAKLCKNGARIASSVSFSESDANRRNHGIGLRPGPCALIFTSLLSVLDLTAESGNIDVTLHSVEDTFEVDMCTATSVADRFFGNISDITSLSAYIRGSCMYLAAAAEAGMYISAGCTQGKLRFVFGTTVDPFPILEFKFRDPEERVCAVLENVLTVLTSYEFNARAEEVQAEE